MLDTSQRRIAVFAAKAVAIYGLWYIAYDLWLLPDGRLDAWLSHNVAWVTTGIVSALGLDPVHVGRVVTLPDIGGVEVANGCNGLTTIGLFIGFVVAYPGTWARRAAFIPIGIFAIYVVNVLRVVAMLLALKYWPAAFDPLHGFGLTTIFYVTVFVLWMVWANYGGAELEASGADDSGDDNAVSSPFPAEA
jgi:exosortase/archaeosortase family protein